GGCATPRPPLAPGEETAAGHAGLGGDPAAPSPSHVAPDRARMVAQRARDLAQLLVEAPVARGAVQATLEVRQIPLGRRALVNQPHCAFTETALHRCPLLPLISPSAPRRY